MPDNQLTLAIGTTVVVGMVIGWITWRVQKKFQVWSQLPTLEQYVEEFPLNRTSSGISCRVCLGGSFQNLGLHTREGGKRKVICNACGTALYRLSLPVA
jgi:hypothetical protein